MKEEIIYIGDFFGGNGPSIVDVSLKNELKKERNITFIQIDKQLKYLFKDLKNFDVLHFSGLSFKGIVYAFFFRIFNKKVFHTSHGSVLYLEKSALNFQQKKIKIIKEYLSFLLANKIVAVSELYCLNIKSTFPKFSHKVVYINNGGTDFIGDKTIKFVQKNLKIISFGGDRLEKGVKGLCIGIENFLKKHKLTEDSVKFYVIGKLNDKSNFNYPFLNELGILEQKEVMNFLKESNLYIQNSFFETFCLSALEAIDCNTPIILSKTVGVPVQLNDDEKFTFNNIDEITEIIEKIYFGEKIEQRIKIPLLSWSNSADNYKILWNKENIL
ncbi:MULTISPECIES: glycosyltransferase family 4 protein [unclassified Exiguobacterium]|uniref:glycosyltransferase family 4 protein n=1 Tax=unclassified Exiguobacterium TaxID=2644629 RepID=UPI001BE87860|nr:MULTISPECIES: glycosyltransferase family 4 protein [unclassified Exiguobacterium]